MQPFLFQFRQIGLDGAQIFLGDGKAGQLRVIAFDEPELGAAIFRDFAADDGDQIDAVRLMQVRPDGPGEAAPWYDLLCFAQEAVFKPCSSQMNGIREPPCSKPAPAEKSAPIKGKISSGSSW